MTAQKTMLYLAIDSIGLVTDKASKLYDTRIELPLDANVLAGYKDKGQRTPISVVTRENLAEFGEFVDTPFVVAAGRQRRRYCEAAGIPHMMAVIERIESLAEFRELKDRENTHREEVTLDQRIEDAKVALACGATIESMAVTFREPVSTIRKWVRYGDETVTAPEVREAIATGELSLATADVITSGTTHEEQKEILAAVAPLQMEAVQKVAEGGQTKRGDAVNVTEKPDGTLVAAPTHATVTEVKAKVKGKKAPSQAESKPKAVVPSGPVIDAALVKAKRANIPLMRRLPGADASFVAGYEAALMSLMGETPELPADAKYADLFRILFPAKAAVPAVTEAA